jgi:uncharacterized protein YlxP (DUF503 family)
MHVGTLRFDLHIPECHSLKQKRAVVKPIVEGSRRRFGVAVAEVDSQGRWQRATIGVAAVSSSHAHVSDILDEVERFIWSFPEVQVLATDRRWLDREDGP